MSFRNSFADNYPVTALLLLLNIGFFVLQKLAAEKLYGLEVDPDMLLGKLDTRAAFSQPWRLISATYLHGGAVHLFFNLYALYYLAQIAEPLISRWKFFTVYTLCGIGGTMLHASWTLSKNAIFDMDTFTRALGASGAIVGLLGALLV
ncbi:MAG: rhomboid family intramembrane serine protease, partial [Planctomycetota bacterium]